MQKLHLVGFTADFDGLIFSTRKGSRSGSFVVPLDARLLKQIADAERRRDGGDSRAAALLENRVAPRAERPESALTPREMQERLRGGWTLDEVAAEAGVDAEWVAKFASPVLAEIRRVVDRARGLVFDKPRFGESSMPLGASVRRNVAERGVAMTDEEIEEAWSAWQAGDDLWVVRFAYRSRGRAQEAEWLLDLVDDDLTARNRLASQLGHVGRAKGRARQPAARAAAATRKAPARRAAVKKALATKAPRRPSAARTAPSTRRGAAGTAAARKASAKKASAKRSPAKKAPAKTSARKAPARKSPAKKASAKKAPAKTSARKSAAKKSPAKKASAKKVPAKQASARTAGRSASRRQATRSAKAAARRAPARKAPGARGAETAHPPSSPERPSTPRRPPAPAALPGRHDAMLLLEAADPSSDANGIRRPAQPTPDPPAPDSSTSAADERPAAPRHLLFDDLAAGDAPVAPWEREPRGPLPPPPPTPVPDEVRDAVAEPIGDPDDGPPGPGPVSVDEETGIARIDSRRTSHDVSVPPRQPVFRQDVAQAAPAPAPRPGPRPPRRRSEPLRGR